MSRHQNLNHVYPNAQQNQPMFSRHLTAFGSHWLPPTQAPLGGWRNVHFPSYPCRPGVPPPPQLSHPTRHLSGAFQPQDTHNTNWARLQSKQHLPPGFPFHSFPHRHFQLGLMECSDKEPPYKRRRSSDERAPGDRSKGSPKREYAPRQARSATTSPNCWFKDGKPPPPGTSPPRQALVLKRQWEDFSHCYKSRPQSGGGRREPPFEFSVMSYNILSQDLLHDNNYLYKHCSSSILNWNHRLSNILKELKEHNADIMCLQEVQEDHYEKQIKPSLEALGYQCEYKRRTGRKPDGCAVVYKKDRFSLLSSHPVEYFRRGIPLLDRDNVGLVLLLRPTGSSRPEDCVCVANTHLLYNPRRGDIKLAQLAMLLAEISTVSRLPDGSSCPIILCGDFNSVPWSPLYSFVRESRLEYDGIPIGKVSGQEENPRGQRILTVPIWPLSLGVTQQCQYATAPTDVDRGITNLSVQDFAAPPMAAMNRPSIEHSLRLTSAYSHYLTEDSRPEITTCHSRTAITVDYIFYSAGTGDISTQPEGPLPRHGLQLLARLALVGQTDLEAVNGLPNEHNSSDHLPILACFRLCP
ncbi:protein angel homolog 2 isoform X1 [Oncorhynchus clarkii lewisi]|uniref:protein angel homolog 2 isoform X1 n=2 Tax=Oncorhynchus clarkii lewisi TaxID=490388 RepID=UPI0039B8EA6E